MPGEILTDDEFYNRQLLTYFDTIKGNIGRIFFFDEDDKFDFSESVQPLLVTDGLTKSPLPVASPNIRSNEYRVKIEPESIEAASLKFAKLTSESVGDITKLFIGAGVARGLLSWRLFPIASDPEVPTRHLSIENMLMDKRSLYSASVQLDGHDRSGLVHTIERIGDQDMPDINVMRFCFGVSLHTITEGNTWQTNFIRKCQQELLIDQHVRDLQILELPLAAAVMGNIEDAFKFYDSGLDKQLLALSFPMSFPEIVHMIAAKE